MEALVAPAFMKIVAELGTVAFVLVLNFIALKWLYGQHKEERDKWQKTETERTEMMSKSVDGMRDAVDQLRHVFYLASHPVHVKLEPELRGKKAETSKT